MKIILIHPPYSYNFELMDKRLLKFYYNEGLVTPPLGICYIAATLRNNGHQVQILDSNAKNHSDLEILQIIQDKKPDVVGISILSHAYRDSVLLIRKIKEIAPTIKIIVGGYHIQLYPEKTIQNPEIDFGVIGEGELTTLALINAIENHREYETIPGIIFRKNQEIIKTKEGPTIENLDDLAFPARDLLDNDDYTTFFSSKKKRITSVITSRGCTFNCIYCSEKMYSFRHRSVENIIAEIDECVNKYHVSEICFNDSTFTINRKHTIELCNKIAQNFNIRFNIRTRIDCMDEEVLIALKKAGCDRIHYGIESGNNEILQKLGKGTNTAEIVKIIKLTKQIGIEVWAFFMIGNPGETLDTVKQTVNFALKLNPDFIQINRCSPLPGTVLHRMCNEIAGEDIWEPYFDFKSEDKDFQMCDTTLNPIMIDKLVRKAYRRFYYRPKFILKSLKKIESFSTLWLYIKAAFTLIL